MRGARIVGGQARGRHPGRLGEIDARALGLGVLRRDQARHGHIDEIRVSHVSGAIRKGELHGFRHSVKARRRARPRGGEIEPFKNIQALKQHRPPG